MSLQGSYGCDPSQTPSVLRVTLEGTVVDIAQAETSSSGCQCATCDGSVDFTQRYEGGWPSYKYGQGNTLKIDVLTNYVCLATARMNITYGPPRAWRVGGKEASGGAHLSPRFIS